VAVSCFSSFQSSRGLGIDVKADMVGNSPDIIDEQGWDNAQNRRQNFGEAGP